MGHIGFIGGGNMATAILGGLIAKRMAPEQITLIDPGLERRTRLQTGYGAQVTDGLRAGSAEADPVVLAVKPQDLRRRVTSPGGRAHWANTSMREDGFAEIVARAMTACRDRAVELGKG
ncbi:hypothetical protein GCM10011415_10310 [Salipiger pallidus]|uniref:Pyrroline-5-carboxylate reductase catalytic N-terminal domain-containing protein n=1 Tax=Salipiger pallidus TaxID=1775170 RepID=A0A8J2ZHN2_9RHOB|nr:NAD(P)-binding domain-containing protein [Salipiger pallidus]GGG65449.1 hypothetical protein GCM10011415_10310 [Salipiger pallidus]